MWFEGIQSHQSSDTTDASSEAAWTDAGTSLSLGNSSWPVRLIPEMERVEKSCCEPVVGQAPVTQSYDRSLHAGRRDL